ncbi:uroporphyrinogen-III synthase [Staphylococcus ratti]|uniref:Uroporphyrinogen-III synthase n=1 Tax=Staphylococcus ratti TaxID=2892440 RepID=A0ABY3PFA4_9STAP|nr:uroporphyrinogen-III synthase [Staphylococcus ratti]UEX91005.1 uroporphyrinogen-III synthase [Staphylococcus ratti]
MKPVVMMTQTHLYEDQRALIKHVPFIKTVALTFDDHVLSARYDWLIFTSKNAVKYFYPFLKRLQYRFIAVIGEKTKMFCNRLGIAVDYCPNDYSQEGILANHPFKKEDTLLIPSSLQARPLLQETLRSEGMYVVKIDLYDVVPNEAAIQQARVAIENHTIDALTFASSSAAHAFFKQAPPNLRDFYYAIGSQTEETIQQYGYHCIVSDKQTLNSIITKIVEKRS